MKQEPKDPLLRLAEIIDAYRIVPRIIIGAYGTLLWWVGNWFLLLENPTTQQSAYAVTLAGTIPAVIGLYQHSGRRWGPYGNRHWGRGHGRYGMPNIQLPPIQPNININQGGKTAGPYDDTDLYDDIEPKEFAGE